MNINSLQFNLVQPKPQKAVSCPLHINNQLQSDMVSFSGTDNKEQKTKSISDIYPKHKGIIYKKDRDENGNIVKTPVEVDIVKDYDYTFKFVRDGDVLGYVQLIYNPEEECKELKHNYLYRNYKKEGIEGGRIVVDYLKNNNQDKYCGIGHLADLVEVAACKELGIDPNVVSESATTAAPLHYLRGKRFVPYKKYLSRYDRKSDDLFGKSPNEEIKKIIENTPQGEKFDTSEIPCMPFMYMPKEMIKELEKELKDHPIF